MQDGRKDGSLVGVLDATQTPMGGRMLRQWLVRPLCDVGRITSRQSAVDALFQDVRLRSAVRQELRHVGDLERLCGKVCTGRATPRDLVALGTTLRRVPPIRQLLDGQGELLGRIAGKLDPCSDTAESITATLVDEPPASLAAGGTVREGVDDELDRLRDVAGSGKEFLTQLQAREAKRTGIPSLKVSYNKVFGYYLEVTNAHKDKAPDEWIRKQTLVNAERYVTPELKEYEETILTAQDRVLIIETRLVEELRQSVAQAVAPIQTDARALATLDVLTGFAEVAERNGYVRPQVDDSAVLDIVDGRHPVVERMLPAGRGVHPQLRPAGGARGRGGRGRQPGGAGAADHRAEHGGQERGPAPNGLGRVAGPGRQLRARRER